VNSEEVLDIFRECGAVIEGHVELTSGAHSNWYFQCALVLQHPRHAQRLAVALAGRFRGAGVELVASPAVGGIVLGQEIARILGVRAIFLEREGGAMALRRGFGVRPGEKVLAVEDVVTTGGSVREVADKLASLGAEVVGVGCIVDRSGGGAEFGCRFESLAGVSVQKYDPSDCPLCKRGLPLSAPGSRKLSSGR